METLSFKTHITSECRLSAWCAVFVIATICFMHNPVFLFFSACIYDFFFNQQDFHSSSSQKYIKSLLFSFSISFVFGKVYIAFFFFLLYCGFLSMGIPTVI
mmetsp:Transcript_18693/g.24129  ORF Transcript_18693/g.24129 Transcript_18693/m.24129 type:complete len:101 (-) Transcript_18693:37-339(-)